ncbi:hypothetical protein QTG54_004402 [Skeletonema marinoi]|uniref:Uncharacterized protein n=1 Tax=Skeletonema marinoi TaxID=267567 RepID=A0AAD8YH68_9STRA|nr:hypothetical protein QTG54_004402 [Skeletonema marinoi]
MSETLSLRGTLKGHNDWVTSIATTSEDPTSSFPDLVISPSSSGASPTLVAMTTLTDMPSVP